ncbi:serrate RNA effector molecule homolog isoform X2 [Actinia tenebrosa]|uniref:Serrate RNA effector molecule homolog isoform X2 n=1 Tax=Actinia tenebrosa TaxID=6105 RepID=A0A6P8HRJ1_ACTTE|nr:serrate RNA effector molecule homolog isoform X2 [Actinia tenebrosa]
MGDSDEEYDRRRARDKFRRERSDYNDRRRDRDDRGGSRREDWTDRRRDQGSWDQRRRGDYREFERGRRDSSGRHHELSPPMPKRMRRDWDDPFHAEGNFPYGGGANSAGGGMHHAWNHPGDGVQQQQMQIGGQDARQMRPDAPHPDVPSGPSMLSFKQFLNAQEDDIEDTEAVRKYQEYKLEFRKTQLGDFFQQHKEEEWFRGKYHPKEAAVRNKEMQKAVKKRVSVFLELMKSGRADSLLLDVDHSDNIVKLLDAVVIKLEGGSDFDLTILDRAPSPERKMNEEKEAHSSDSKRDRRKGRSHTHSRSPSPNKSKDNKDSEINPISPSSVPLPDAPPPSTTPSTKSDPKPITIADPTPEQKKLQEQAQFYHQQSQLFQQQQGMADKSGQQKQQEQKQSEGKEEAGKKKRKHRHREPYYYDAIEDESESESDSESDSEPAPPGEEMSSNEAKGEEELLPPGVEAEAAPAADEDIKPPGVDDSSTAEAAIQLPTSSSGVEKDDKPDSAADDAVGSSEPEMEVSSQDTAATKPTKPAPGTSDDSAIDSTQSPDTKPQSDSPDQSEESIKRQTGDPQVGSSTVSSDATVSSAAKDNEDVDMAPESSSDVVRKISVDGEAESNTDVEMPSTPVTPQNKNPEEMDSNRLAEKKEVKEEESPVKPSPAKESKENAVEEKEKDSAEDGEEEKEKPSQQGKEVVALSPEPRPLHKTYSLFMRNIPPSISKGDIAAICKRFTGFLRVALSDPSPDRRFYRRGWITFERSVNIKEICWDLNNIRLKDVELNPVVNRDLSRRVRTVSGLTFAKQVIREDIKLAAQLIRILDKKSCVYEKEKKMEESNGKDKDSEKKEEGEEGEERADEKETNVNLPDENPILASLSEDATEEEEGEEMELLGTSSGTPDANVEKSEVDLTIDENLLRVLDRLVLYLRIVHSLDYYNGGDYPHEDEMPNRCGIIHVRGPAPEKATQNEVQEWQKTLKQKLEPFMQEKGSISDEEVTKLGKKDPEAEIEKFVEANTQELAKDKWLCPLSGKKFRGPDFVRKHIFNKHAEKVEAVRLEAEFFNRYLSDPRRPQNLEVMQKQTGPQGHMGGQMFGQQHDGGQGMMGWGPRPHMMMYGPRAPYTPPSFGGGFGPEGYGRGGGGHTFPPKPRRFGDAAGRFRQQERGHPREPRQIVQYRDLDAPEDTDMF